MKRYTPISLLLLRLLLLLPLLTAGSCMSLDYGEKEDFNTGRGGLFIVCEGNYQYGNASLSYFDPASGRVENEVFLRANGYKLGDVAQSMTVRGDEGWIVVNNSHVIFAIDLTDFKEIGRIENLPSPRFIHFVSDSKAYVSQLWDNRVMIVNPQSYAVTGSITIPGMEASTGSTEQMVQIGRYLYCSCWSYQDKIIKIDTETDRVVAELRVGLQPRSLVKDCRGMLWTITDGGYEGSPVGHEAPALYCIDPVEMKVVRGFRFRLGEDPLQLQIDSRGENLYWINSGVWRMDVAATRLPVRPVIEQSNSRFNALTVEPENSEIYVADAFDYQQRGRVYRYTAEGELMESFYVGVTPGEFCWK